MLTIILFVVVIAMLAAVINKLDGLKQMLQQNKEPPVPAPQTPKQPWKCVTCGTENEGNVPYCLHCQTNREWSKEKEREEKENLP